MHRLSESESQKHGTRPLALRPHLPPLLPAAPWRSRRAGCPVSVELLFTPGNLGRLLNGSTVQQSECRARDPETAESG